VLLPPSLPSEAALRASRVFQANLEDTGPKINLKGVGVGNGLTVPQARPLPGRREEVEKERRRDAFDCKGTGCFCARRRLATACPPPLLAFRRTPSTTRQVQYKYYAEYAKTNPVRHSRTIFIPWSVDSPRDSVSVSVFPGATPLTRRPPHCIRCARWCRRWCTKACASPGSPPPPPLPY